MEHVVLANKHHLNKLTQNSVFNKICNVVKQQYQLRSFKELSISTTKIKNIMGYTLVHSITTATREEKP